MKINKHHQKEKQAAPETQELSMLEALERLAGSFERLGDNIAKTNQGSTADNWFVLRGGERYDR